MSLANGAAVGAGPATVFLLLALGYNALLAIVNAHVMPLNVDHVAVTEFFFLSALTFALLRSGLRIDDVTPMALGASFLLLTLLMSFMNEQIIMPAIRNCAIIVLFTMLGARCSERTIRIAFAVSIGVVFAVMLWELLSMSSYSATFGPQSYYFNTRGLGGDAVDDTGLFPSALGFDGRFTFGIFKNPRTSSIFIEMTSLANFASVAAIYTLTMWRRLGRGERIMLVAFVVLALVSNNTRLSSTFAMIVLAGYFVFPLLPARATLLIPFVLLGAAILLSTYLGPSRQDDLAGRIGLSVWLLSMTDISALIGARAPIAGDFPDSGYSYVLYSSSIVGALALWLFVSLIVPFRTAEQRRCAWAIAMFFFLNLLISGNSVFSIKIGSALWMLAGFVRSPNFADLPAVRWRRAVRALPAPVATPAPVAAPQHVTTDSGQRVILWGQEMRTPC